MSEARVRSVEVPDEAQWRDLYSRYRTFYGQAPSDAVLDTVWSWLHDSGRSTEGLVAVGDGGAVLGLAHIRRFDRPSTATTGLYLDDLFTHPDNRGRGIGRLLIREIASIADREGLSVVRWITAAENAVARSLYDSEATPTEWITYDMAPSPHR